MQGSARGRTFYWPSRRPRGPHLSPRFSLLSLISSLLSLLSFLCSLWGQWGSKRPLGTYISSYFLIPTSYFLLPYFLLPTSFFLLHTSYFLLPTPHFLLSTSCFLLPTPYFLLRTFLLPTSYLLKDRRGAEPFLGHPDGLGDRTTVTRLTRRAEA